jgi:hypothetical protein
MLDKQRSESSLPLWFKTTTATVGNVEGIVLLTQITSHFAS